MTFRKPQRKTLWYTKGEKENCPFVVDLPMNIVIFRSSVNVYQRATNPKKGDLAFKHEDFF